MFYLENMADKGSILLAFVCALDSNQIEMCLGAFDFLALYLLVDVHALVHHSLFDSFVREVLFLLTLRSNQKLTDMYPEKAY